MNDYEQLANAITNAINVLESVTAVDDEDEAQVAEIVAELEDMRERVQAKA